MTEEKKPVDRSVELKDLQFVAGPNLTLRLIRPDDAEYVCELRKDTRYNRHLSNVSGSVDDQRAWIEAYKAREAKLSELYYVIERKDVVRCGLVRLYDIDDDSFTWGSWILDHNKPRKAALESAVLSFGIGFEHLNLHDALVDVRIKNLHAMAFYRRFNMVEVGRDDQSVFFRYTRDQFVSDKAEHLGVLKGDLSQ